MAVARLTERVGRLPVWVVVAAIWLASRIVTTALMLWFASRQEANAWTGANPDYFEFANLWDGAWYRYIAFAGYASELPLDEEGHVTENAWAFMPGYPMLVRGIMLLTGLEWSVASVLVSVVFSAAAAFAVYTLLRRMLPTGTALFAVTIFCFAPTSPVLQVAYAESMHVFFLAIALGLLIDRRYGLLVPVITVMAITRPAALPFALALGFHVLYRWFTRHRDPYPLRERLASIGVTVFSAGMGFLWPALAWMVTGSLTAYTDTELAWRAPYIGRGELTPFTPWFESAMWWLPDALGLSLLILLLIAFTGFLLTRWARRLGPDLMFWVIAYALYLLAVFFPQSSTFRLLIPLFPLAGALAAPRWMPYRVLLIVACIVGQYVWIDWCWWIDGADWTPP